MGMTMSEKILARAAGLESTRAGDIVWVRVDKAMMDDILGPRVSIDEGLGKLGLDVKNPGQVVIISDHYTPPASVQQAEIVKFTRDWARKHRIDNYYEFAGPCHQVMIEKGHVLPWHIVVGTDSHTCMGGALGAFATGIGSTEMLGVLVSGEIWYRVPQTIRVEWRGRLRPGVMAKDISLETIRVIGHAGATYMSVEYAGPAICSMPLEQRMAITNMAVEMGAKVGLMEPDDKVRAFLGEQGFSSEFDPLESDSDATFARVEHFDASTLDPMVACPHAVDNVHPVDKVSSTPIHQAYLGSCTGGRYSDLAAAAAIMKGRHVARGVRMLVSPASMSTWKRADADGTLRTLADAGAVILAPTCGVCVGLHSGLLAGKENCISSSNRNFIGRMGSKEAGIYLGSPMTVAASAIAGHLCSPLEFMERQQETNVGMPEERPVRR